MAHGISVYNISNNNLNCQYISRNIDRRKKYCSLAQNNDLNTTAITTRLHWVLLSLGVYAVWHSLSSFVFFFFFIYGSACTHARCASRTPLINLSMYTRVLEMREALACSWERRQDCALVSALHIIYTIRRKLVISLWRIVFYGKKCVIAMKRKWRTPMAIGESSRRIADDRFQYQIVNNHFQHCCNFLGNCERLSS